MTTPVCPDCLARAHVGAAPDFAHHPAAAGETCGADDHRHAPGTRLLVETMPAWLVESHRAANNFGSYPANGAERRIVDAADVDDVIVDNGYDRIIRIASDADVARYSPARLWRVTTSNDRFYQIHDVVAVDEAAARALAESEDGANSPEALEDERLEAAKIGQEPGGRYVACRVEGVDGVDPDDRDQIAFVDAGAEG